MHFGSLIIKTILATFEACKDKQKNSFTVARKASELNVTDNWDNQFVSFHLYLNSHLPVCKKEFWVCRWLIFILHMVSSSAFILLAVSFHLLQHSKAVRKQTGPSVLDVRRSAFGVRLYESYPCCFPCASYSFCLIACYASFWIRVQFAFLF